MPERLPEKLLSHTEFIAKVNDIESRLNSALEKLKTASTKNREQKAALEKYIASMHAVLAEARSAREDAQRMARGEKPAASLSVARLQRIELQMRMGQLKQSDWGKPGKPHAIK